VSGVSVVGNSDWRTGLATSLQTGLTCASPKARGVLVLLVDQPKIGPADLDRLIACWRLRPDRAAAAFYDNRAGAPAVIPRRWYRAVRSLEGDRGARQLLRGMGEVSLVDMPAAAFDVDTPADAALLTR
jgi:molybdenum cofactor cytidylyltransferase